MEEDIKILEEFIKAYKIAEEVLDGDVINAIENLIARNKELEKENKILKSKQTKIITDSFHEKMAQKFNEEFITKKRVKDKIEELDKLEKNELKGVKGQDRYSIKQEYMFKRNILQKLLEES